MAAAKTSGRNCLRRKGLSGFLVRHGRKGMEERWTWKCEIEAQETGAEQSIVCQSTLPPPAFCSQTHLLSAPGSPQMVP